MPKNKLPFDLKVPIEKINLTPDELEQENSIDKEQSFIMALNDYLSDTYGFLVFSFNYEVKKKYVYITSIHWDTEVE